MDSGTLSSMTSTADKVRENRLRRMASRRGLRLEKSRLRDIGALGYGTYRLAAASGTTAPTNFGMTLDDVENALTEGT